MPLAPVLARRHRLWPTVSVAVLLRRVEKHRELHQNIHDICSPEHQPFFPAGAFKKGSSPLLTLSYPQRIKKTVCELYGMDEADLLRSRRGVFNEPRNVAIYLTRRLRGDSLSEIGDQYQMNTYSSVSSVIERVKALISEDSRLKDRVGNLSSRLSKSREQT